MLTNFHLVVPSLAIRTNPSTAASFPLFPLDKPEKNMSGCCALAEGSNSEDGKKRISAWGTTLSLTSISLVASRKRGSSKKSGCRRSPAMSEYCMGQNQRELMIPSVEC